MRREVVLMLYKSYGSVDIVWHWKLRVDENTDCEDDIFKICEGLLWDGWK
jgi:hypothetical protein